MPVGLPVLFKLTSVALQVEPGITGRRNDRPGCPDACRRLDRRTADQAATAVRRRFAAPTTETNSIDASSGSSSTARPSVQRYATCATSTSCQPRCRAGRASGSPARPSRQTTLSAETAMPRRQRSSSQGAVDQGEAAPDASVTVRTALGRTQRKVVAVPSKSTCVGACACPSAMTVNGALLLRPPASAPPAAAAAGSCRSRRPRSRSGHSRAARARG